MQTFVFRSVGQGFFYTGVIDNLQFVYDCGAVSSRKNLIKTTITKTDEPSLFKAIDDFRKESVKSELDFLAISHLHADHVNGISELSTHFSFKKVFLPYFDPVFTTSLAFSAYLFLNGIDSETSSFLTRAYQNATIYSKDTLEEIDQGEQKQFYLVKTGTVIHWKKWTFRFYCNPVNVTSSQVNSLDFQIKKLLTKYKFAQIAQGFQNNGFIKDLRSVYSHIFITNLNETSLVLLHYPESDQCPFFFCDFCRQCFPLDIYPSTLLSGDLDYGRAPSLAAAINRDIINTGRPLFICSLPHHGSFINFNGFLANIKAGQSVFVMCYGIINPWPHSFPNFQTISQVSKAGNRLIYVNEFQEFRYF